MHVVEKCLENLQAAYGRGQSKLAQAAEQALVTLTDLYCTSPEVIRFRIIHVLADFPIEQVRQLLEQALDADESSLVRHEAASGLGMMGDSSTIELLISAVKDDPSYLVRHEAALALESIGDETAFPALEQGLNDDNPEVVISCQVALSSIRYRIEAR